MTGKLIPAEEAFLNSLMPSFDERERLTNVEMREATGKSESSAKRFMRKLTEKGALEARGGTRNRQFDYAYAEPAPLPRNFELDARDDAFPHKLLFQSSR